MGAETSAHGVSLVLLPADLKESRGDSAGIAGSPAIGEKTVNHLTQEGWKGIKGWRGHHCPFSGKIKRNDLKIEI